MATLFFRKHQGVIDSPLSYDGYKGELSDEEKNYLGFIITEYNIYCGDIGEASSIRDKRLKEYRDEIISLGHNVVIRE